MVTGNCYGAAPARMSASILEDSYSEDTEPVLVPTKTCAALQQAVFKRYPGIRRRQERIRMLLKRDGYLECANGSRRQFFGRKTDHSVIKDAYAHHAQVMTTWATSLAWHKMWTDEVNRGSHHWGRRAFPHLLRHDSIVFSFKRVDTDWVKSRVQTWFDNVITIAGTEVVVPWSGGYGPSWGDQSAGELRP